MIFLKLCQCLNLTLPLACWQMAQMTQITQMCADDHKCVWVCVGVRRCAQVCAGVRRCARVCTGVRMYTSVCCARLYLGVSKCAQVCMCVCKCKWDELSEYLLETRFLTSANYSTHPLRILFYFPYYGLIMHYILLLHLIFVMVHIFISPDLYIPDKQFHPLSFLALLFNPGCWVLPNNKLTHNTNVLLSRTLSAFKLW